MSLSAKQMHKLRKVLYKLYPNGNEATFYLTTANIQNVFVTPIEMHGWSGAMFSKH